MTPRKLNLGIVRFPYAGNGGTQSEHPDTGDFLARTIQKANADERIGQVLTARFADCPITLTRNKAVRWAQDSGVDVLIMIDSDQAPDLYVGHDPNAKPFFESSFDFLCQHWEKGPITVFAPYCGPPTHPIAQGHENCYVFRWENYNSGHGPLDDKCKLEMFTRQEASMMTGISDVGAGPTGLCMIDMRLFDVIGKPYFDYEYVGEAVNCTQCNQPIAGERSEKASTEDVFFFRNVSLNAVEKLGYNPVFCNWDAWAGHWKPWCVGKPETYSVDKVHRFLRDAVLKNQHLGVSRKIVTRNPRLTPNIASAAAPAKVPHYQDPMKQAQNTSPEDLAHLSEKIKEEALPIGLNDRKMVVVELGSWVGDSCLAMLDAIGEVADVEMHCVDHWKGGNHVQREAAEQHDAYDQFCRNIGERLGSVVFPHRMSTLAGAQWWADNGAKPIDFLFIDADHSYESCLADIKAWLPFMRDQGVICGHDYNSLFPGVKQAVHEVFGWGVSVFGTVWGVRVASSPKNRLKDLTGKRDDMTDAAARTLHKNGKPTKRAKK